MGLTAKQEAFAQAVATGSNQTDAYRSAYNAENMAANVIYVRASELAADSKVAVRIATLKAGIGNRAMNRAGRDKGDILRALWHIVDSMAPNAISETAEPNLMHPERAAVALKALDQASKIAGAYAPKETISHDGDIPPEVRDEMNRLTLEQMRHITRDA